MITAGETRSASKVQSVNARFESIKRPSLHVLAKCLVKTMARKSILALMRNQFILLSEYVS
jgi:hypothetical protein